MPTHRNPPIVPRPAIPDYQPFYIESVEDLRAEIARLGLGIPLDSDLARLAEPLVIGRTRIPNRFCAQPIAGGDAAPDGAPGELTRRRYRRYADGRFGLIWVELTASGSTKRAGQLCLNEGNLAAFRAMVQEMRAAAAESPAIIIQLGAAQADTIIHAATLAAEAGFDGVDLRGLGAEAIGGHPLGAEGGSVGVDSPSPRDMLPKALAGIRERAPGLLLAARLCVYEAVRGGFGVSAGDFRKPDMTEPISFVQRLRESGLGLLNVTAASPNMGGTERGSRGRSDSENPDEHPLTTLDRQLSLAHALRTGIPGLPVVGSGFSWLRQFVPDVAAGALRDGMIDFVGLGRGALAYPDAPAQVFAQGRMEAGSACMVCLACSQLREEGETVGCVLRDVAVYGPVYRQMRRFDADQLMAGAARCHWCEAAPCVAASPTRMDIPAFIQAFRKRDESGAYEIIRARDLLPELTARFSPGWLESEGACIEIALTGTPVPILDLQYAIAWRARDRGQTGARVPARKTGGSVAVVGGGPAGIAAAARLVELGHVVHLYERSDRLGGAPERVSAVRGLDGPREEIEALLRPALAAERLYLHFGASLGPDRPGELPGQPGWPHHKEGGEIRLEDLRAEHDAVLIATGLWQERSLGKARGVMGALAFLESPDDCAPARAAVLAGGDGAMDAARLLQARRAKEIFVVFGGPRSAMHWHMAESWFATPGVQAMMQWQPLGYEIDGEGQVRGVRLRHSELGAESVLAVEFVIEAMELQPADGVRAALAGEIGRVHMAGALVNGGASVGHCVAEGLAAAAAIHRELSS